MDHTHTKTKTTFSTFFLACGLLMAASEIWKQVYLTFGINGGSYDWWYFPFQLCSMPMYLLLVLPHLKEGRLRHVLLSFLMCYGTLGGVAVFADTSGLHYPVLSLTVHSYLWHLLQIVTGIASGMVFCRDTAPCRPLESFLDASLLYLIFCGVASLINRLVSPHAVINMFYINPRYPMSQVVFRQLIPLVGNDAAIFLYIAATVLGAGLLFCIWRALQQMHSS